MRTIINKDEMRREWVLNRWYEKWMYVIAIAITALYLFGFFVGFIIGLTGRGGY
jgi:hypothetical protein